MTTARTKKLANKFILQDLSAYERDGRLTLCVLGSCSSQGDSSFPWVWAPGDDVKPPCSQSWWTFERTINLLTFLFKIIYLTILRLIEIFKMASLKGYLVILLSASLLPAAMETGGEEGWRSRYFSWSFATASMDFAYLFRIFSFGFRIQKGETKCLNERFSQNIFWPLIELWLLATRGWTLGFVSIRCFVRFCSRSCLT